MEWITNSVHRWAGNFEYSPLIILGVAAFAALFARLVFFRFVEFLTRKTETDLDDKLILALRPPVVWSFILAGIGLALGDFELNATSHFVATSVLQTLAVLIWAKGLMGASAGFLEALSRKAAKAAWIQPRTVPIFEIVTKVVIVGGAVYLIFISWHINLTSWIASAGIVGIAVGFAAKDSLANLFAGVFILADAPYQIGDFIVLDGGTRGVVTEIGIRSTRLLTRDDVEVTLPNALIANGQIVNQTQGPYDNMRVRVQVAAAYGSDVDQVTEVLLSCAAGIAHVSSNPEPKVRFRTFGDSGLNFELLAWIDEPVYRGRVIHALNTTVYKRFNEEGIEIPYAKQDLYIKEFPNRTE